jgi:hypothetical protein
MAMAKTDEVAAIPGGTPPESFGDVE